MHKINKSRKGFTLTELMLVLAIIFILAAVLAINVGGYLSNSNSTSDKIDSDVTSLSSSNADRTTQLNSYGFV